MNQSTRGCRRPRDHITIQLKARTAPMRKTSLGAGKRVTPASTNPVSLPRPSAVEMRPAMKAATTTPPSTPSTRSSVRRSSTSVMTQKNSVKYRRLRRS